MESTRPGRAPRPTRRDVLVGGLGLAVASQLPACGSPTAARPPNVLFVLSDAHRACALGCYGNLQVVTPHMDALARDGVRLTTAVSNTPQCRPYRASLMSGSFGHHTGVLSNAGADNLSGPDAFVEADGQWDPRDLPLLGESFRAAGYRCGYIGKWDLGRPDVDPGPLRLGFDDEWLVWKTNKHDYYRGSYYTNAEDVVRPGSVFRPTFETDRALAFIESADERPWFLVVSWGPPHGPLKPPPGHDVRGPAQPRRNVPPEGLETARMQLAWYYGLVEAIDVELGRLVAGVDASAAARETLVVYTSDHGTMLGSQGVGGKEVPWSESTAVPFLARWPGHLPATATIRMPFGTPDILPTLAGLAGLPAPRGIDGRDCSAALRAGADDPGRTAVYLTAHHPGLTGWPGWRGVRTASHLYARLETGPWLLYDVDADPDELLNLVDEQPALRDELDGLTRDLMSRSGDSWRGA